MDTEGVATLTTVATLAKTGTSLVEVPTGGADDGIGRHYLHCQWVPRSEACDAFVGISDDRGFFQIMCVGSDCRTFYRVGYCAVTFASAQHSGPRKMMWDVRPWSQFVFVPNMRGAVIFIQWQSDAICWTRFGSNDPGSGDVLRLGHHSQRVRTIAVDDFGNFAASGSDDGAISVWCLGTLALHHTVQDAHVGATTALKFHRDGLFSAGTGVTYREPNSVAWAMQGLLYI